MGDNRSCRHSFLDLARGAQVKGSMGPNFILLDLALPDAFPQRERWASRPAGFPTTHG
jgi:hypothetical protein